MLSCAVPELSGSMEMIENHRQGCSADGHKLLNAVCVCAGAVLRMRADTVPCRVTAEPRDSAF